MGLLVEIVQPNRSFACNDSFKYRNLPEAWIKSVFDKPFRQQVNNFPPPSRGRSELLQDPTQVAKAPAKNFIFTPAVSPVTYPAGCHCSCA
jgi:hypothetical protein